MDFSGEVSQRRGNKRRTRLVFVLHKCHHVQCDLEFLNAHRPCFVLMVAVCSPLSGGRYHLQHAKSGMGLTLPETNIATENGWNTTFLLNWGGLVSGASC